MLRPTHHRLPPTALRPQESPDDELDLVALPRPLVWLLEATGRRR